MGVRRSAERLAEAAKLYYIDELNQEEVASALGTTRSNVSRMLLAARRQGIVKFHVTHPLTRQTALEQRLVEAFGITEAVVLAADAGMEGLERTGELAARWLAANVVDGQTVALSWGRSLQSMAEQLQVERAYDISVVPIGGDVQCDPRASSHELVREVATRLGGQYSYLHAPAVLESERTAADLVACGSTAGQLDKARKADLAMVGLGGVGAEADDSDTVSQLTGQERSELQEVRAVGEIAARFFDESGREVGPLRERVVGLELEDFHKIPVVAGVAAGPQKARPLWAAMRSGLVDVVLCDQSAAAAALQLQT